jgi:hypothetical protein
MASIYTESVEEVYQQLISSGLTKTLIGFSSLIGFGITIHKIIKEYWETMVENEKIDMRKLLKAFMPYLSYLLLIIALPFLIYFVEHLLAQVERLVLEKVGDSPSADGFIEQAEKEQEFLTKELGIGWTLDFGLWMSYLGVIIIRPIMIFFDNYLFCMALAGRYLYLIMLQIIAPICIIGLLYEKTSDWFWSWSKNLLCCYLLVPAFMISNFFAESLFVALFRNGAYGGTELLFIIALKLFLYKQSGSRVFQLIK